MRRFCKRFNLRQSESTGATFNQCQCSDTDRPNQAQHLQTAHKPRQHHRFVPIGDRGENITLDGGLRAMLRDLLAKELEVCDVGSVIRRQWSLPGTLLSEWEKTRTLPAQAPTSNFPPSAEGARPPALVR